MPPIWSRSAIAENTPSLVIRASGSYIKQVASLPFSNSLALRHALHRRQATGIIPTSYDGEQDGMAPAAVAGIVIASAIGFGLLSFLLWWSTAGIYRNSPTEEIEEIREVRSHPRSRSPPRSRRSRRSSYTQEMRHKSRSRSPRATRRTEIVEERITREDRPSSSRIVSRGASPHIVHETVIVEDAPRRHSGDDEVIVIEDSDMSSSVRPPRRHRSRRSSGFRPVDPEQYGGGEFPRRSASRGYS